MTKSKVKCPDSMREMMTPIGSIRPSPENPRIGHDTEGIAKSLLEFGWHSPIVVDSDGEILIGHGRRKAAIQIGESHVPVVTVDDDRRTAIRRMVADNRLTELSTWDTVALSNLSEYLDDLVSSLDLSLLIADGVEAAQRAVDADDAVGLADDVDLDKQWYDEEEKTNERFMVTVPIEKVDAFKVEFRRVSKSTGAVMRLVK